MNQISISAKLGLKDTHSLFRHRFAEQLMRDARLGARHFILEGNLNDLFYNTYFGTKDFLSSLASQLLWSQMGLKRVMAIHPPTLVEGRQVCITDYTRPDIGSFVQSSFNLRHHINLQDAMFPDRVRFNSNVVINEQIASPLQPQRENLPTESLSSYRTAIESFPRAVAQYRSRGETAFVFCDFFTQAGFFKHLGPDAITYVELLDSIWKTEDCLTIVPCESTEAIEENFFPKLDERVSVVRFGPPGIVEIDLAISRGEQNIVAKSEGFNAFSVLAQNEEASLRESIEGYAHLHFTSVDFALPQQVRREAQAKLGWKFEMPSWADVVLVSEVKQEIAESLVKFRTAVRTGSNPSTCGILLVGPPGTGKTLIAKALAANEGFSFVALKLSDIKAEFLGQTGANIRRIFERAKRMAPVIIFVDEIEAILPIRGHEQADSYTRDAVCELLTHLDGVGSDGSAIFFVGATNRGDLIDGAALSRLKQIKIDLPDQDARREIFAKELSLPVAELTEPKLQRWLTRCSVKSRDLSGRDIKRISGAILSRLGVRGETEVISVVKRYSEEVLNQVVDDALRSTNSDLRQQISRAGHFLTAASMSRVPGNCLRNVDESFSRFCVNRGFISRYRSHRLPPISRLLLRADRVNQSEKLVQILASKLDADAFRVDAIALGGMASKELDEWIDHVDRITKTCNLVMYLPAIEQIHFGFLASFLARLPDDVAVVGTASTTTPIDDLFDQSVDVPTTLSPQTIQDWVSMTLSEGERGVNLGECNPRAIAVYFSQQKNSLGLCGIEREVVRALRQAVLDPDSTDAEIKLRLSHFRKL